MLYWTSCQVFSFTSPSDLTVLLLSMLCNKTVRLPRSHPPPTPLQSPPDTPTSSFPASLPPMAQTHQEYPVASLTHLPLPELHRFAGLAGRQRDQNARGY